MTHAYLVELSCISCGAKLGISNEVERYTCSYCGTAMMVERRGDELTLRGIADMLREAQDGATKHAAEMALARYTKELNELRNARAASELRSNVEVGRLAICATIAGALGLLIAMNGAWLIGLLVLAVALLAVKVMWRNAGHIDAADIDPRIIMLKQLIKKKERIANE